MWFRDGARAAESPAQVSARADGVLMVCVHSTAGWRSSPTGISALAGGAWIELPILHGRNFGLAAGAGQSARLRAPQASMNRRCELWNATTDQ